MVASFGLYDDSYGKTILISYKVCKAFAYVWSLLAEVLKVLYILRRIGITKN